MNNNRKVGAVDELVAGLRGVRVPVVDRPKPTFKTHPTQWNVVVREFVRGEWRSRVVGRVYVNRVGRFSAIGEDDPLADVRDFNTSAAAIEAVKRDYRRRRGL